MTLLHLAISLLMYSRHGHRFFRLDWSASGERTNKVQRRFGFERQRDLAQHANRARSGLDATRTQLFGDLANSGFERPQSVCGKRGVEVAGGDGWELKFGSYRYWREFCRVNRIDLRRAAEPT